MKNKRYNDQQANDLYNMLPLVRHADKMFTQLCNEVDNWRAEADYWKQQYDDLKKEYSKHLDESLKSAQQGVANALMFALSVEDEPDGSLKINPEKRKHLADSYAKQLKNYAQRTIEVYMHY